MLIHRGLLMELLEVSRNRKPVKRYSHIFTTSLVRELPQKMPVGSIHFHTGWWIIRLLPDEHDCPLGTYPVHQDMQSYPTGGNDKKLSWLEGRVHPADSSVGHQGSWALVSGKPHRTFSGRDPAWWALAFHGENRMLVVPAKGWPASSKLVGKWWYSLCNTAVER